MKQKSKSFTAVTLIVMVGLCLTAPAQTAQQRPLENQSTVPQTVAPGPLQPQTTAPAPAQTPAGEDATTLPDAPSSTAQPQTVTMQPAQPSTGTQQPLGTAAAEKARTAGGGASKPAGTAIAPAKQRQVRSFLIKAGLIAAGGIALGTVYALTKGSPSKPPNTTLATQPAP